MKFIDLHCDTISKMYEEEEGIYKNNFSVDIEKMTEGECTAQFFATFIELKSGISPYDEAMKRIGYFKKRINEQPKHITITNDYDTYELSNDKIHAFLTLEEGETVEGSLDKLIDFYKEGVRLITLTWNFENSIGYPHCHNENLGLKKFGFSMVECMNDKGIIIDVSHLSDKGFYDVAEHSKKPFIASHSNSRVITNVSRNLTDNMIKTISNSGGVVGINFLNHFLGTDKVSTINSMITHIKHIENIGGIDVVAIGSDFDGIDNEVEIRDSSQMQKLKNALSNNGFSEDKIEKIFYRNAERVIKDILH